MIFFQNESCSGKWEEKHESIDFAGFHFNTTQHRLVTTTTAAATTEGATTNLAESADGAASRHGPKTDDNEIGELSLLLVLFKGVNKLSGVT